MTSRRKQIKPIKAHSNQTTLHSTFAVSDIVDSSPRADIELTVTTPSQKENSNEALILRTTEEPNYNINVELVEMKSKEITISKPSLDGISDDISKKIHKDDAKILPFETNNGVDLFQCPICDQSSISGRENLTCHLQEHQNKTKRDDGKHLCCLCSKELSSNSSLERHLLTHSNHRPFSCILCDKKFTTNGNLSRHIKTSHNNNGTIDSSIDEVLKKHQLEVSLANPVTDSNQMKLKKSHKTSKKEPLNMDLSGLKGCTVNFMSTPLGFLDHSKADCTAYQQILPGHSSNINVLSPFYSFHDYGFVRANLPNNCNIINPSGISIVASSNIDSFIGSRLSKKALERKHLDSLLPNRLLAAFHYRRKISRHVRNVSHNKRIILSTNSIECIGCHRRILSSTNVMAHIKFCYKSNNKTKPFCPFKLCSRKFRTLSRLIRHIQLIHLNIFYQSIEPVSPPLEPLNLSIKDCSTNVSSSTFNDHLSMILTPTCESILDLSGSSSGPLIHSMSEITQPGCETMNQFISHPTFVTLAPFSFSTPLTFSTPALLGKPPHSPVQVIVSPVQSHAPPAWPVKFSHSSPGNNFSTIMNNNNEGLTSSSNSISGKYIPGIKKKNSYKDAPKLITCPMDGCVQKFPWNSSLMRHILTHTAHKPFKCTRCVKSFSTKSNRERHMTRVHRVRINRLKFKSLQASKSALEDLSKPSDDGADSENGADAVSTHDQNDMRIVELSEEEWIIMDDNDRRAEDISSNLLKLAGQPIVEPNPVRLHNVERKVDVVKSDSSTKKITTSCGANDSYVYLDSSCI